MGSVTAHKIYHCSFLLLMLISGCQSPVIEQRPGYTVDHRQHAPGQQSRVQMVVLHYTAENNARSLAILTGRKVSAHYLIPDPSDRQKSAADSYQLVPESQAAWHAGLSGWGGLTHLNNISIGIELVNSGYYRTANGYQCHRFPPAQIRVLEALLQDIVRRYPIRAQNIVGHSDIAPGRKQDPGPCFPWQTLAASGIGAWPDPQRVSYWLAGRSPLQPADPRVLSALLKHYGYPETESADPGERQDVIKAFQMHFRPAVVSGLADAQTEAIARALLDKYGSPF